MLFKITINNYRYYKYVNKVNQRKAKNGDNTFLRLTRKLINVHNSMLFGSNMHLGQKLHFSDNVKNLFVLNLQSILRPTIL